MLQSTQTHDLGQGWTCVTSDDGTMSIMKGRDLYHLSAEQVRTLRDILYYDALAGAYPTNDR